MAVFRWISRILIVGLMCLMPGVWTIRFSVSDLEHGISQRLPQGQAERMIRTLNLLPGVNEGVKAEDGPPLLERKIQLGVGSDLSESFNAKEIGHSAGYFKLNRTFDARMFYFFFESRGNKTDDPLVLWLSGGPGCGSEVALFYENGPFHITDDLSLVWNDYGWDKVSNIIFLDQPVGTGFSYSTDFRDIRHEEGGVSEDVYDFLEAFFKAHPQYLKNAFFVTGESYAGHYVPAVTSRIHSNNKKSSGISINLKGFAIGNGLTQPDIQYEAYADYALEMGIIGENDYKRLSKIFPICTSSIKLCGSKGTVTCVAAYMICQSIFNSILSIAGNINYYDVRKECGNELCYDFSNMETFLNQKSVQQTLGVVDRKFVSCSPVVYEAMIVDWMRNLEVGIPALLQDGIKLLVYAGEYDLVCNWLGNFKWVTAMDWSGQQSFAEAPFKPFKVDGDEAGSASNYGPLTFLKVHDAGHMVPMDQPKNALEMLSRWIHGKPLTESQPNTSETESMLSESISTM
ncbi:hypothetical protein O6H91_20G024700 [Diphasiastrum complanatum]|uniref:Uncharacterized protein n=1 Tax=Diphasiastrum complanatum TaxID=34168 RepID=A0ACC2ANV1_DIPCM|nr:hypothetical protein O6H91_20G024700 [Diphasiastrum complanatum]